MKKQTWTQAELEEMVNDARKNKPNRFRRAKQCLATTELKSDVARKTGFRKVDVARVIDTYLELVEKGILEKKSVSFGHLFTVTPTLRRARQGTNFHKAIGENQMIIPPRFDITVLPNPNFRADVRGIYVNQDDIDNTKIDPKD